MLLRLAFFDHQLNLLFFYCTVNYMGMVRCCKAFLPVFKDQAVKRTYRDMRILNVTSMAGLVTGQMGLSAYAASKHAANAFSSCLRMELKMFSIQVTTVNPSFHATPLVDSMPDLATKGWDRLTKSKQEEYGHGKLLISSILTKYLSALLVASNFLKWSSLPCEAFFERYCFATVALPRKTTWKANVVVDEILKSLKSKRTAPDLLIGMDARYALPILKIVPEWCKDLLLSIYPPCPTPAVMKLGI